MYTFIISIVLLVLGYVVYSALVEKIFVPDSSAKTPVFKSRDGIDYVPMRRWRLFLIQFLNIAGLGPIFGAIMGVLYGPSAFLWIVFGCIFGGGVHDYLTGMMSVRLNGVSLPEVLGEQFGHHTKHVIRLFLAIMIVLLILVTTSFLEGVAVLLQDIVPLPSFFSILGSERPILWTFLIFLYFGIATIFPIDRIIGKVYPFFGAILLFMGIGVSGVMLFSHSSQMPEIVDGLQCRHSNGLPVFPMMLMSISCGAISGFHGTQSPMMARCMTNERQGRQIFYGAMICEGILALIWAYASVTFFADPEKGIDGFTGLNRFAAEHPEQNIAALVVNRVCSSWLGLVGGFLAVLGVIFAPITSGDTALRSARLMIADAIGLDQKKVKNRLILTALLLVVVTILLCVDFNPLWRYFTFANQTIAALSLWGGALYLFRQEHRAVNPTGYKFGYLVAWIPAMFMTYLCVEYILIAPEGFDLLSSEQTFLSHSIAAILTLSVSAYFYLQVKNLPEADPKEQ